MPVRQLLCGWLDRRLVNQGRMSPIRGTANLALEMLEDRAVPAVVYNLANTQARPTDYSTKSIFVTFAPNTKPDLRLGAYAPGLQVGKGYNLVPMTFHHVYLCARNMLHPWACCPMDTQLTATCPVLALVPARQTHIVRSRACAAKCARGPAQPSCLVCVWCINAIHTWVTI